MTFGCTIPSRGTLATPQDLKTLAARAEDMGFDHLWVSDHIVIPKQVYSAYPYTPDGVPPFDPGQPYCEPLSTLCYLAAATRRIKLGVHVLVLPYREPVFTAKIISTLDHLSGGRAIVGVGVGWMEEEFLALGQDTYAHRGAVTDEHIRIYKELWTQDSPSFQGRYHRFDELEFLPKPVQKPHPPIWVGGHSTPAMKRAARLGDGWMPVGLRPPAGLEPDEMAQQVARLRSMTEAAGRPREELDIVFSTFLHFDPPPGAPKRTMAGTPDQIVADIGRYREAGVQHFIFGFSGDTMEALLGNMDRFARGVLPHVG